MPIKCGECGGRHDHGWDFVTLTSEQSKLQHALATTRFEGHSSCNPASALQVAQLILKNRQNSNQRQRIVIFIGSPLGITTESQLVALEGVGRLLKKNGVSLDIISFGSVSENENAVIHLLAATGGLDINAAKKNIHEALLEPSCQCHLLVVRPDENLMEALRSSPIFLGEDGAAPMGDFGMDGDMDPELAMALKMSLEEEQARLNKEKGAPTEDNVQNSNEMVIDQQNDEDEDAMTAHAIAMSLETATSEAAKEHTENKQ